MLLWRGVYEHAGVLHADAVRAGLSVRVEPGQRAPAVAVPADGPLARFAVFSDGWLVADPRHAGRVGDARYAMLPTSLEPLWGIEVRDGNVSFEVDRSMPPGGRETFMSLLRGR